jgi:hypothetical protein
LTKSEWEAAAVMKRLLSRTSMAYYEVLTRSQAVEYHQVALEKDYLPKTKKLHSLRTTQQLTAVVWAQLAMDGLMPTEVDAPVGLRAGVVATAGVSVL